MKRAALVGLVFPFAALFMAGTVYAQPTVSYSFYDDYYVGLKPDNNCGGVLGCGDAISQNLVTGHSLASCTEEAAKIVTKSATSGRVTGTSINLNFGGSCGYSTNPTDLDAKTAGYADGDYYVIDSVHPSYLFFSIEGGVVSTVGDGTQAINFNSFYVPTPFDSAAAAIAASSSLWGAFASTSALVASCSSGNVFSDGICSAVSFLFLPNPNVLNGFFSIPQQAGAKFPFSWIYAAKTEFDSLTVSSTTAMTTLSFNFHNLGIGSTTPMGNILPNTEVFSKNTIETYISPTLWNTFQNLIAAAMWLAFVWFELQRARRESLPMGEYAKSV